MAESPSPTPTMSPGMGLTGQTVSHISTTGSRDLNITAILIGMDRTAMPKMVSGWIKPHGAGCTP